MDWWGIVKADVGIKDGRIVGIGKAGNPDTQKGVSIETYKDHRIAMSFAILGCTNLLGSGKPWLRIKDPYCCAKTFPHFFDVLERLRIDSLR